MSENLIIIIGGMIVGLTVLCVIGWLAERNDWE